MQAELESFNYNLVPLPLPKAIYNQSGQRLPASYLNFLIINGAVLVPSFNDKNDGYVMQQFQKYFSDRKVIAIDARILIQEFGGLHCAAMQLPSR